MLATHDPDVFPDVPARVALTVAGHLHGGQVNVPILRHAVLPTRYGDRYLAGHVVESGRHLYVSAGLGTAGLPLRLRRAARGAGAPSDRARRRGGASAAAGGMTLVCSSARSSRSAASRTDDRRDRSGGSHEGMRRAGRESRGTAAPDHLLRPLHLTLNLGILLALGCAIATQLGFLYKHRGANEAPSVDIRHPLQSGKSLFRSKWFAIGMGDRARRLAAPRRRAGAGAAVGRAGRALHRRRDARRAGRADLRLQRRPAPVGRRGDDRRRPAAADRHAAGRQRRALRLLARRHDLVRGRHARDRLPADLRPAPRRAGPSPRRHARRRGRHAVRRLRRRHQGAHRPRRRRRGARLPVARDRR